MDRRKCIYSGPNVPREHHSGCLLEYASNTFAKALNHFLVSLFSTFWLRHGAVLFQPERAAVFRNLQVSNQGTSHVAQACIEARTREVV